MRDLTRDVEQTRWRIIGEKNEGVQNVIEYILDHDTPAEHNAQHRRATGDTAEREKPAQHPAPSSRRRKINDTYIFTTVEE